MPNWWYAEDLTCTSIPTMYFNLIKAFIEEINWRVGSFIYLIGRFTFLLAC